MAASTTTRMTPGRLRKVRWADEHAFRVLDYYFTIRFNRWECGPVGEYLHHVLGGFAVEIDPMERRNPPTPGLPAAYSLVNLRNDEHPYRLALGDTTIYSAVEPWHLMAHLFWHINAEAIRQTGSYLLVHAGAVSNASGQAVLLPAKSGSGKTTLTAALVKSGFDYLTDEAAAIDPVSGDVFGYPKALTMKDPSMIAALVCSEIPHEWSQFSADGRHVHPLELRAASMAHSASVSWIITPRYERGADTTLTRITPAETAAELLSQTLNSRLYGRRALKIVSDLARKAHGYRLVSGDLNEALCAVTELLAAD